MAKAPYSSKHTDTGMPCFYPEGNPADWCERHTAEARVHLPVKPRVHA